MALRMNPLNKGLYRNAAKGRFAFLVEIILGISLVTAVNVLLFRQDLGFLHVHPHPYWAIVIPIAVRYGFHGGFLSGLLCGLLYLFFEVMTVPDISFLELRSVDIWGHPLLFWLTGMVLGETRQGQIRQRRELENRFEDLNKRYEDQQKELSALTQAKQEVDSRIFSQEHTLSTIYEAAQALRSLNEEAIFPAILDLLSQYLSVEECAIYVVEDGAFHLKASKRTVSAPPKRMLSLDADPLGIAWRERRTVTLDSELRNNGEPSNILITAPVLSVSGEDPIGVITVDRMPFLKFNPTSIRMASLIADWCGASLENASLHQQTREQLMTDEVADAYNYRYFLRRLQEEFLRARRYGLELSVVHLEIPHLDKRLPEEQRATQIAFASVIKSHIRTIDLVFLHETIGTFLVILPTTPRIGAEVVVDNITRAYQALVIMSFELDNDLMGIRIGIGSYTSAIEEVEELVQAMQDDIHEAILAT